MLKPGDRAPEFTLHDQDGRERSLTSLLGDGALILYFYPADFTPGCTAEACTLRDLHTDILRAGLRVVGISPQEPDSHREFRAKYNLPFTLPRSDKAVIRSTTSMARSPSAYGARPISSIRRAIKDAVLLISASAATRHSCAMPWPSRRSFSRSA
jgi:peroxiredoxin Q/BCP